MVASQLRLRARIIRRVKIELGAVFSKADLGVAHGFAWLRLRGMCHAIEQAFLRFSLPDFTHVLLTFSCEVFEFSTSGFGGKQLSELLHFENSSLRICAHFHRN